MAFGSNPVTGNQSALPSNQFPISTVAVPNATGGNLTATQGGPAAAADVNGNVLAPVSTYVYDGNNVAQGTTTDAAYSGSGAGTEIAILKKLVALLSAAITISGTVTSNAGTNTSTAALALETGGNLASAKTDLDAINTAIGAISDTAYSGSGNGSEIALLKKIVAELAATLTVSGTVGVSSLPALASGSNLIGNVELVDSAGTNKATISAGGAVKVDNSAVTQPVSGTVSITANSGVNVAQVAGTTTDTNSGTKSAGTQRIVLATDQPQLTNALKVDGSAVTQPVSAASLPLPSGASTAAKQPALGTAGTASTDVLSVQGIASMTALKTDGSGVTQPVSGTVTANAGTNLNTSLLAVESGGHLANIDTNTAKIPAGSASATLQSAQAGNANGSTLSVLGMGSANFTVNMSAFSGSVIFEGSGDGTNFQSISVNQQGTNFFSTLANGASTSSITLYTCSVASLQFIRARTASVSAGTVTVTAEAVPLPWTYSASTMSATQGTSPWTVNLIDGQAGVNLAGVDSSNRLKTIVSSALPAGANVIGHVIADSGSTTAVTSLPALPAGSNLIGNVELVDSAGTNKASIDASGNQAVKGGFTEQASLSAGVLNADLVASTDVSAYKWFSIHVNTSAFVGTLTIQGSNDNANFVSVFAYNVTSGSLSTTISSTNQLLASAITYRYLRIRMTAYTSGTAQGTLELYTSPASWLAVEANQAGNWNVNIRDTGATTINSNGNALNVSGSHSNATVAANTASNTVIKASAGVLCTVTVTTLGTAGISFFDNASTNTGTVLLSIPASAAVGTIYTLNGAATTGIVAAGVTNCPGLTVFYF